MADRENLGEKAGHEKQDLPIDNLEVGELEEEDLDDVSGGDNSGCTINYCPQK
jgi:hypothetical protein